MANQKKITTGAENLRRWRKKHPEHKPNLKHGVHAFLSGGYMPAELQRDLETFESQVIQDLGGDPTMAQRVLIATARRALGVVTLGWAWIEERGLVDQKGDVNPVAQMLASYMNALRLSLVALGIERKPRSVKDLDAIIKEHSHSQRGG